VDSCWEGPKYLSYWDLAVLPGLLGDRTGGLLQQNYYPWIGKYRWLKNHEKGILIHSQCKDTASTLVFNEVAEIQTKVLRVFLLDSLLFTVTSINGFYYPHPPTPPRVKVA
jgi:hypothetical protein